MIKLLEGHWYRFNDRGEEHVGQYIGRQFGFPCCVCDKGNQAYTFNVWYSSSDYETWGYGREHLPNLLEDLGITEGEEVYID